MNKLTDRFGRTIDYLRVSVTDRCNLRCVYCMPAGGIITRPHEELLSFEEIVKIMECAAGLGIDKIRFTGGEPLVRQGLPDLIKAISGIEGIRDVSMTTNGVLLGKYAAQLKDTGLGRLNISLDSLKEDRYAAITRYGKLGDVLDGIEKALEAGFSPVKINVLLLDDMDPDEIKEFLRFTFEFNVSVRFLEFMRVNSYYRIEDRITCAAVMEIARRTGQVEGAAVPGNGPARTYKFKNAMGTFGLISPVSNRFCESCNRLRLTSDGFLKPCLHSDRMIDLRSPLRSGAAQADIAKLIRLAVSAKPEGHHLERGAQAVHDFSMCQIGG